MDFKIWVIGFGGGNKNFHDAVKRIQNELNVINFNFYKINLYTDNDLKNDDYFWKKHGNFIENNNRGYGYWLWKPYLIMKTLNQMNNNDILIYLDIGCEIKNSLDTHSCLLSLINRCNDYHFLYTFTGVPEKKINKMDLLDFLDLNNNEILDSYQKQASLIFLKKNDLMLDFATDWYNTSCNYHFIDDTESMLENNPEFLVHRHDQSIFSLLAKTKKYKDIMDTENNLLNNSFPFLISRKRHG
jgi:hypothetical protein